jgi:hypothetical protein
MPAAGAGAGAPPKVLTRQVNLVPRGPLLMTTVACGVRTGKSEFVSGKSKLILANAHPDINATLQRFLGNCPVPPHPLLIMRRPLYDYVPFFCFSVRHEKKTIRKRLMRRKNAVNEGPCPDLTCHCLAPTVLMNSGSPVRSWNGQISKWRRLIHQYDPEQTQQEQAKSVTVEGEEAESEDPEDI